MISANWGFATSGSKKSQNVQVLLMYFHIYFAVLSQVFKLEWSLED